MPATCSCFGQARRQQMVATRCRRWRILLPRPRWMERCSWARRTVSWCSGCCRAKRRPEIAGFPGFPGAKLEEFESSKVHPFNPGCNPVGLTTNPGEVVQFPQPPLKCAAIFSLVIASDQERKTKPNPTKAGGAEARNLCLAGTES